MYVEKLNENHINAFRKITPLKVNNKPIPFKIFCNGKWYDDPRGKSDYAVFLKDYSCTATFISSETKVLLQKHYVENFMSQIFPDYMENYKKEQLRKEGLERQDLEN